MTATGQSVCAVLVTVAEDEDFRATLNAVLAQGCTSAVSSTPGEHSISGHRASEAQTTVDLIVVDASEKGVIPPSSLPAGVHLHHAPSAPNFGRAIDEALRSQPFTSLLTRSQFLWLLHADSTPELDCLDHLLATSRTGTTIGVVGPKLLDATGTRALSIGINATRSARYQETSLPEEIDQGQYDGRVDVLAVSTAGMLVSTEAWKIAGGLDPILGPYGDGLEFGRRIRRLGYRVVVSPKARVIHHRRSWQAKENLTPVLRARTYNWLMAVPLWQVPVLMLYTMLSAPLRALIFSLAGQARRAWSEALAGLYVLADSPHLIARRLWIRRHARVPRQALTSLELPSRALRERRKEIRKGVERLQGSEVSPALAAAVRVHRARTLVGSTVIAGVLSIFAVLTWAPLLNGVAGAAWAQLPSSWLALWEAAWTPWIPGGDGAPGVSDPAVVILAFLTAPAALMGLTPYDSGPWLLALSLPAAGAAGWALASTLTLRIGARGAAALLWASLPALTFSVSSGRVTAVLFHVALPLVVAAWFKLFGLRFRRELAGEINTVVAPSRARMRWWGPAACGTFVLTGLVPATFFATLILLVAALLAMAAASRRLSPCTAQALRGRLWRVGTALVPSGILVLPSTITTISEGGAGAFFAYLSSAGPAHSSPIPTPWELLAGMPQGRHGGGALYSTSGATWLILAAPPVMLCLWAVVRATHCTMSWPSRAQTHWRTQPIPVGEARANDELWRYWMPPLALLSAGVLIAVAYGTRFIPVGLSEEGIPVYAWPASALSAAAACLLVAVCAPTGPSAGEHRLYQGLAVVSLATLVASVGVTQSMVDLPVGDRIHPEQDSALPAASVHAQESARQARVLYVDPTAEPLRLRVYRGRGPVITDSSALMRYEELARGRARASGEDIDGGTDPAWHSMASAALTTMTSPDLASVEALAEHGIDTIVVTSHEDERGATLARALDRAPGVERGAESEAGASWRIRPSGVTPSRALLLPETAPSSVNSEQPYTVLEAGTFSANGYAQEARRLHLAERASAHWVLRANGEILPPSTHEWAQAWMIPRESELRLTYDAPWMSAWKWMLVACMAVMLAGFIPVGRKE